METKMPEPNISQKKPYFVRETPGTKAWCQCGKSANQPYCDGSHEGSGFEPIVVNIEEEKDVYWCGCKHSANKPYCDGTHKTL